MRIPDDSHVDTKTNAAKDEQFQNEVNTGENAGVLRREWQGLNLEAALATALYLNAFIRHANSVGMANFCAPMPMSLGLNGPDNNSAVLLPPIFYPFELYSRTCGQSALNVFWSGETFSGKFKDRLYSGLRALDVAATLDETHNQLVIYVVNQSKEVTMETTISLDSGEFIENVRAYVVNGPAVGAENTVDKPNQIATRELSSQVSGKSFIYNFEPHSITALICAVK
jgi:alpha-N-arabinofuranosidase